jgi:hypothetical protein
METAKRTYGSLDDIIRRKSELKQDLTTSEKKIGKLWNTLFTPDKPRGVQTPSMRLKGLFSTGAGLFDGILLGWKLYRRFLK